MTFHVLLTQMMRANPRSRFFRARRGRVLRVASLLDQALATRNDVECGMLLTRIELELGRVKFPRRPRT